MKVLITGASGATAIGILRALKDTRTEVWMADSDPHAAGLQLVPKHHRRLTPDEGMHENVAALLSLCETEGVDVIIPTGDSELLAVAEAKSAFTAVGTSVLVNGPGTLRCSLDRLVFASTMQGLPLPRTEVFDANFCPDDWDFPVILKSRRRTVLDEPRVVANAAKLELETRSVDTLIQEYLPGPEYAVDVLCNRKGIPVGAVPGEQLKVEGRVAVAMRTVRSVMLIDLAKKAARRAGATSVVNVTMRRNAKGVACLVGIRGQISESMALTIASGINMPTLALRHLRGWGLREEYDFRDTALVRCLTDLPINIDEFERTHPITRGADLIRFQQPSTPSAHAPAMGSGMYGAF